MPTLAELIKKRNKIANDTQNGVDEANKVFKEHGSSFMAEIQDLKTMVVEINIEYGDWKHDHLYADWVMEEKGFKKIGEEVTFESGEDWASSVHFYHV